MKRNVIKKKRFASFTSEGTTPVMEVKPTPLPVEDTAVEPIVEPSKKEKRQERLKAAKKKETNRSLLILFLVVLVCYFMFKR